MPFQFVEPCAKAQRLLHDKNSVTTVLITIIVTTKGQAFTVVSSFPV